jgi:hypothetical protein
MSLLGSLFGSDSKNSQSQTYSSTKTQDQRVGVEGGLAGGQLVGPEANVANPGGIATSVGDYGQMTQTLTGNKFKVGMTGNEVAAIVQQANVGFANSTAATSAAIDKLSSLANTALGAVQQAQTGVPADLQKYIVPIGALIVAAIWIRRKRRRS